jgi:hypothetical protein
MPSPKKSFFIFMLLIASSRLNASPLEKTLAGHFSILGRDITWTQKDDEFAINGLKETQKFRVRFEAGKERIVSPPSVIKLDGKRWETLELIRQIGLDTQSPIQDIKEIPAASSDLIKLSPDSIESWHHIDRLPISVRAELRSQLKNFVRVRYGRIRRSVEAFLAAKDSPESLPKFLQCLVFPRETPKSKRTLVTVSAFRDELMDPCLGLNSPSTPSLADSLLNLPAPVPLQKIYFSHRDPSRPLWDKPTFIIVHTSQDFHYPATIKSALEKRIEEFRKQGGRLAFLIHNDNFNDASYFVRPAVADITFYTETGKHPLCENCRDVTFAGGFIDWCFGLAIRSYIANYFRNHSTGEIRINLAADSIYTEIKGPAGSEGAITALTEIQKDGERAFVRKRLGQYFNNPKLKDIGQALCWISDKKNEACKMAAAGVFLSEVDGRDNDGKFYPFFEENRFRFQIQLNGEELVQPLGDLASPRTITFNVLTK